MRVLDLFSGIGGFSLGLERAGMETVAFCEIEEFPRKVLRKHWPDVPIFEDVRKLTGEQVGPVELICGGYPCQPFSLAGKREGKGDDRHLWPEYLRLIRELRPSWVIGENVAGHISMGLDDVLSDLEREGYSWEAFVIPACAVDARHRRDRVWIVARHSSRRNDREEPRVSKRQRTKPGGICEDVANARCNAKRTSKMLDREKTKRSKRGFDIANSGENVPNSNSIGLEGRHGNATQRHRQAEDRQTGPFAGAWCQWEPEPDVGRVANGIPNKVDRLKALGNAVVPQIPEIIGRAILEIERANNGNT